MTIHLKAEQNAGTQPVPQALDAPVAMPVARVKAKKVMAAFGPRN